MVLLSTFRFRWFYEFYWSHIVPIETMHLSLHKVALTTYSLAQELIDAIPDFIRLFIYQPMTSVLNPD